MSTRTAGVAAPAKPRKPTLLAKPACKVGRHGYHQYEIVKQTRLYRTWQCRLCDRRVKKPMEGRA